MKTLAFLATAMALSTGFAVAQDLSANANNGVAVTHVGTSADVNGFRSPATLGPVQSSKVPNIHPNLKPQGSGVFVDGDKYGAQLINPLAPASYGMGEKYLAAPSARYDLERESGRAAHHDAGGIKLFGFEF